MKSEDKTYLETYNCEYIKSPKPERFSRAMVSIRFMYLLVSLCYYTHLISCCYTQKQFYRPDFVLSHFVHYSTVTVSVHVCMIAQFSFLINISTHNPSLFMTRRILQQKSNIPKVDLFNKLLPIPKQRDL